MIILKAEGTLAAVFRKTIKVTGQNVEWDETFAVNNNTLILPGKLKSLFFSFDNKKVIGSVIEESLKEEPRLMLGNQLLENAINLVLYVFGKWGKIKGLTVEKDYAQLEHQMNNILSEVHVRMELNATQCSFYKDSVRITYEEVIEFILEYMKPDYLGSKHDDNDDIREDISDSERNYKLGLWHRIIWKSYEFAFSKNRISIKDKTVRIGNNFYVTGYQCPECKKQLYMAVYPEDKEFHIETDESAVIIARAYTCVSCHRFYTPKPYKLLMEGSVYMMDFEDDKTAYEDYQELLGTNAKRISNSHFNRYENSLPQSDMECEADSRLEELYNNMQEMSAEEIFDIADMLDSGFYPQSDKDRIEKELTKAIKKKKMKRNIPPKDWEEHRKENLAAVLNSIKLNKKQKNEQKMTESDDNRSESSKKNTSSQSLNEKERGNSAQLSPEEENEKLSQLSPEQEKANSSQLLHEEENGNSSQLLHEEEKGNLSQLLSEHEKDNLSQPSHEQGKEALKQQSQQNEVLTLALSVKNKSYAELKKVYNTIEKKECPQSVKQNVLDTLKTWMQNRGEIELKVLTEHFPKQYTKNAYEQFIKKFEEYKDIDNNKFIELLNEKRDLAEQSEMKALVNQKKLRHDDRKTLIELVRTIEDMDCEEKNKRVITEELKGRIKDIDEAAIKRICPDIFDITFNEGIQAYERIEKEDFLPELKIDFLNRIRKRLETLKKDECRNLVNKLIRDTGLREQAVEGFYPYDIRRMENEDCQDTDAIITVNAVNTYAGGEEFEYPLLVFDATKGENGKRGFVLTPDHLYYNSNMMAGTVSVSNIKEFYAESGLFHKGIYIRTMNNGEMRITNGYKEDKDTLEIYLSKLNGFIRYLHEKPESRSVKYLAEEKHDVKCCYRCGYVYKYGNICPKCGSRNNE